MANFNLSQNGKENGAQFPMADEYQIARLEKRVTHLELTVGEIKRGIDTLLGRSRYSNYATAASLGIGALIAVGLYLNWAISLA